MGGWRENRDGGDGRAERADGVEGAAVAADQAAEETEEAERGEDGAVVAVDDQGGADEEGGLQDIAEGEGGAAEAGFEAGDAFHLETDVCELVVNEFIADAAEDGVSGGGAQAGIIFLSDKFGDDEDATGPAEVAEGADAAENAVGKRGAAGLDADGVHEAEEECGVFVFLAHEEDGGLVEGGVAVLQRDPGGFLQIVARLGGFAALEFDDGGGDARELGIGEGHGAVPGNLPGVPAVGVKVIGPPGGGAERIDDRTRRGSGGGVHAPTIAGSREGRMKRG